MLATRNDAEVIAQLAQAFIAHTGLAESTVSTKALNDGKRLKIYREGTATGRTAFITPDRFAVALGWFDRNWPSDLEWPADIPRPGCDAQRGAA